MTAITWAYFGLIAAALTFFALLLRAINGRLDRLELELLAWLQACRDDIRAGTVPALR